jgi:hypothetical protein
MKALVPKARKIRVVEPVSRHSELVSESKQRDPEMNSG